MEEINFCSYTRLGGTRTSCSFKTIRRPDHYTPAFVRNVRFRRNLDWL